MSDPLLLSLGLLLAVAALVGVAVTECARRVALRTGLVDRPGARKIHARVMPYGGGLAIYGTLLLVLSGAYLAAVGLDWRGVWPALAGALETHVPGLLAGRTVRKMLALGLGATAMLVLGLVDDRRGLSPATKLIVQGLAALGLVWADVRITLFLHSDLLGAALTVLWIVGVTNAFNLLDNMDGLAGGVGLIAALLFLVIAVQGEQIFVAAFLAALAGALLGFLAHNFPPARLFLGDAGSLLIGFLLAAIAVAGTYYGGRGSLYAVCMPLLVLGVPLFDTTSVMLLRWHRGKPLFEGDTNHVSHRLVRMGMTRREAVLAIYMLALILGCAATLLRQLDPAGAVTVLLLGLCVVILLALFETAASRAMRTESDAEEEPGDRRDDA